MFDQGDALIRHWLHAEPDEDAEAWATQVAQALWLEKRHLSSQARLWGGERSR